MLSELSVPDSDMALHRAWRSNIRENLIDIVENLDPVPVVEFALQQHGLPQDTADLILEEPSTKTRVKKYLDLLDDMNDDNFRRFVDGVSITGQGHVAGLITGRLYQIVGTICKQQSKMIRST